jgi:hypothetical protein
MGYTTSPWNGQSSTQLLVIGRNALKTSARLPGDLQAFVQAGGRVLLSGHDPYWLRANLGCACRITSLAVVFKVGNNPRPADLMIPICATGVATARYLRAP